MAKKKTGPARMLELGRKKIEVWLSAEQHAAFLKFAAELNQPAATIARRCLNASSIGRQMPEGFLRGHRYD